MFSTPVSASSASVLIPSLLASWSSVSCMERASALLAATPSASPATSADDIPAVAAAMWLGSPARKPSAKECMRRGSSPVTTPGCPVSSLVIALSALGLASLSVPTLVVSAGTSPAKETRLQERLCWLVMPIPDSAPFASCAGGYPGGNIDWVSV